MPLYAGLCRCDITPPLGVWLSGYAGRPGGATGVHDPLHATALVLENGEQRLTLVVADLVAFPPEMAARIRAEIAAAQGTSPATVMLHATHTHAGPYLGVFRDMGDVDDAYSEVLTRKLIGVAKQAGDSLQPAHLIYGETSAQIGVNRRRSVKEGRTVNAANYAGPIAPLVQTLCVNGMDGRTVAMLFCHACHPTTLGGENLQISAEWPGRAAALLERRFRREAADTGYTEEALAIPLVGCAGDINPLLRGTWETVETNARVIAEAAHTARWNAHGRLSDRLSATETVVDLPLLPPFSHPTLPFAIQHFALGGVHLLGFPAEMFVQYQLDFSAQSRAPVFSLGYTNGCWNYVPTAAEYPRGGYEVEVAYTYYQTPMFTPDCERLIRSEVYRLLALEDADATPYPLLPTPSEHG